MPNDKEIEQNGFLFHSRQNFLPENLPMTESTTQSLADKVAGNLPYLRCYAWALTGSQDQGDRYASDTLEAILTDASLLDHEFPAKTPLFKSFHKVWSEARAPVTPQKSGLAAQAKKQRLSDRRLS